MKIVKNSDDTLIAKSYGVLRVAMADWQTVAPPLAVFLALLFFTRSIEPARPYVMIGGVIFLLICLFGWAHKSYANWQIILESEYETAAIYSGKWGARQTPEKFPLDTLAGFQCVKREWTESTRYGPNDRVEYTLFLIRTAGYAPRIVGIGRREDVERICDSINGWLSAHRHPHALDSDAQKS